MKTIIETRLNSGKERNNKLRGYKNLIAWKDAITLYVMVSDVFAKPEFVLSRIASNAVDATQGISRNIAEGYGRKSRADYLRFLDYAISSAAESHSCCYACFIAGQITENEFEELDKLQYKIENTLMNLIKALTV